MSDASPPTTDAPSTEAPTTEAPTTEAPTTTSPPTTDAPSTEAGSLKDQLEAAGIGNSEAGAIQLLCSLVDEAKAALPDASVADAVAYVAKEAAQQRISFLQALGEEALHACVTVAHGRAAA